MSKRRKLADAGDDGDMDMSPMIDMVFLLLIFFVVNATAITVKKDSRITMPVANNAASVQSANGCIVINVYDPESKKEGSYGPEVLWGTDEGQPLRDEAALVEYIKKKAEVFKAAGYDKEPGLSLYLRGDQNSLYKYSKAAIKCGGQNGVFNVMFATLPGK